MAREIERKFLVNTALWRPQGEGVFLRQGYLPMAGLTVARVRVGGDRAWLTIKGETRGMTRLEFEYPIPPADGEALLEGLCRRPLIEKTRHAEMVAGALWSVDVFHGDLAGLVLAEIELADESQIITLPPWAGREVTGDPRYYNSNLTGTLAKGKTEGPSEGR